MITLKTDDLEISSGEIAQITPEVWPEIAELISVIHVTSSHPPSVTPEVACGMPN